MKSTNVSLSKYLSSLLLYGALFVAYGTGATENKLYIYTLNEDNTADAYDEAVAVACVQGILNRNNTMLYLLSDTYERPAYWLDTLSESGEWLENKEQVSIATLSELVE